MSDRSPADVLADAQLSSTVRMASDGMPMVVVRSDGEAAQAALAALADEGFLVVRPGDPWTDTDGRRWEVRATASAPNPHLWPADDVEDPTDG